MENYDHLFNKHFDENYFKSEEDREKARILFNKLMNQYKNYIDYNDILNSWFSSLSGEGIYKPENLSQEDEDSPEDYKKVKAFTTNDFDSIDSMVEEYNLIFSSLKVELFKDNSYFVNEMWYSKDDEHVMEMKYILTEELFQKKTDERKKLILLDIIDNNIFNESLENESYVGSLPKDYQIEVYEKLMSKMIDYEAYEKAAVYRDIIDQIS